MSYLSKVVKVIKVVKVVKDIKDIKEIKDIRGKILFLCTEYGVNFIIATDKDLTIFNKFCRRIR